VDALEESEIWTSTWEITSGLSCLAEILADWSCSLNGIRGNIPEERLSAQCDLDRIEQHADSASYIDGFLERRASDVLEVRLPAGNGGCATN
jgi:hypothetical protein